MTTVNDDSVDTKDGFESFEAWQKTMIGIDAARRVGWAKYYEVETQLGNERMVTASREGMLLGLVEGMVLGGVDSSTFPGMLNEFLTPFLSTDEPGIGAAFDSGREEGMKQAVPLAIVYGTTGEVVLTPPAPNRKLRATRVGGQSRCPDCNKLLAVVSDEEHVWTRCSRCNCDIILGKSSG